MTYPTSPTDGILTGDDLNRLVAVAAEMDQDFHAKMAAWEYQDRIDKEDKMTGNRDLMFGTPPIQPKERP
jgi:hypothetical protein